MTAHDPHLDGRAVESPPRSGLNIRRAPAREVLEVSLRRAEAAIARAQMLTRLPQVVLAETRDGRSLVERAFSERLSLSEARFKALVAVAGHATWTLDSGGAIVLPQPGWHAFTGQRYHESRSAGGFGWLDAIHPADRDATAAAFKAGVGADMMFEHHCRLRRVSDVTRYDWRHALLRAVPVRDQQDATREWVVASTDVTEYVAARDIAEAVLREREDHYRHAVELNPQIPWTATARGYVFDISPRWYDLTGNARDASRRVVWREVQHPDDIEPVRRAWIEAVRSGTSLDVEHRIRTADGSYRFMRSRASPRRDDSGRITHWYGTTEDVDARHHAERAERRARGDAERARDDADAARHVAEAAVAAKGRILAAASHDLRSPMDAISRYGDILREGMLGPITSAQREVLDRMNAGHGHLLALVNDILHAAEAESNEVEFLVRDVGLSEVCTMLDDMMRPLAEAARIRFECRTEGADDTPIVVRADPERLLQILVNLVSNALKFTAAGGAVLVVSSWGTRETVSVRVSDTGCGVPPSDLEAIFRPFVQAGQVRSVATAGVKGVGLGLATSRSLARRMGGEISVSSEVGVGSVFTVVLPSDGAGAADARDVAG